jgi:hypothetical protein
MCADGEIVKLQNVLYKLKALKISKVCGARLCGWCGPSNAAGLNGKERVWRTLSKLYVPCQAFLPSLWLRS